MARELLPSSASSLKFPSVLALPWGLGCATGVSAVWPAQQGFKIPAFDLGINIGQEAGQNIGPAES
jgi:hypothetical protein